MDTLAKVGYAGAPIISVPTVCMYVCVGARERAVYEMAGAGKEKTGVRARGYGFGGGSRGVGVRAYIQWHQG